MPLHLVTETQLCLPSGPTTLTSLWNSQSLVSTSSMEVQSPEGPHARFAGMAVISHAVPRAPETPLTLVSHLDDIQVSTTPPTLHFLVLTAASQGHVLLTSLSSS